MSAVVRTLADEDAEWLRRQRARAQWLSRRRCRSPEEVVRHLLAVQSQDLRSARLALRARGSGFSAADVDRALGDGLLVIGWLLRGTLHLVHRDDYPWLLALTAPVAAAANRRRLAQEGVAEGDLDRAVRVIDRALSASGPLSRAELGERLAAHGIPTTGQALPHLLMLAALRGVPLFRGLGRTTLLELNQRARAANYEAGATLITEGEPGETLFVLVRGGVAVYRAGELVGELGSSDYFGEMSLIDGAPRSATIVATEDTDVLRIGAEDFSALMRLPEVAREVLRGLIMLIRDPQAKLHND